MILIAIFFEHVSKGQNQLNILKEVNQQTSSGDRIESSE